MIKKIFLLGSTGSIGTTSLKVIRKNKKKFKVELLTTNKNIYKLYKQALEFNVKNVVIFDKDIYLKYNHKFEKKKISVFFSIKDFLKKNKKKSYLTINAISGIEGLEPTLNIIKYSKSLAIANKESIICGWNFIKKELMKYNTKFVPLDSEHFSIWSLLKDENINNVKKIYLTASGGPFLFKKLEKIQNIKPKFALEHPNWKMGRKISIDSATMMNKIFEVIEAIKIFDLKQNKLEILVHPKSYIHAIIHFNNGITKLLAHTTTMEIPIANVINSKNDYYKFPNNNFSFNKLNGTNFFKPDKKNFPLLNILNYKFNNTFLEVILVTINDGLVRKYLENKISYISIHKKMITILKKPYFSKYYKLKPKNINDISFMIRRVNNFLEKYIN